MDGRRTLWEIAASVRHEFGEAAEPAETRLGQFVALLRREALVEFPELESKSKG